MDLGDLKYLDAPAKVLKLSEAIREFGYKSYAPNECVLGCAISGVTGRKYEQWPRWPNESYQDIAQRLFNVPRAVSKEAEQMCLNKAPPAKIADWVQAQGY